MTNNEIKLQMRFVKLFDKPLWHCEIISSAQQWEMKIHKPSKNWPSTCFWSLSWCSLPWLIEGWKKCLSSATLETQKKWVIFVNDNLIISGNSEQVLANSHLTFREKVSNETGIRQVFFRSMIPYCSTNLGTVSLDKSLTWIVFYHTHSKKNIIWYHCQR